MKIQRQPAKVATLLKQYVNAMCEGFEWFDDINVENLPTVLDICAAIRILENSPDEQPIEVVSEEEARQLMGGAWE